MPERVKLTILVVDDQEENLFLLSRVIARMGHEIVVARSGEQAVALFAERAPDLVLMDVVMPGAVDGIEATRRIKAQQGSKWVPVIFVTAASQEHAYLRAMEAGGDDYVTKPVSGVVLRAKLAAVERVLVLQRETAAQRERLERYYYDAEEEQKVAGHLMQRLVQVNNLRDPAVRWRLTPARHMSGDLIAAARTPAGDLHVLLADGTGHGLTASLGVMPVVQPFYAMTAKGFGLSTILQEINRKVRDWLPPGRFVAATVAAIDYREGVLQVWNGGNPPAVVVGRDGSVMHRFDSRQLPLGILPASDFDATVERVQLPDGCELVACSDGVIEAQGAASEQFGRERLLAALARAKPRERMDAINQALEAHLAGAAPHDDVSLVVVDCALDCSEEVTGTVSLSEVAASTARWRFAIELGPDELRSLDVVPMLIGMVESVTSSASHRANLFVIFSELFNNAFDHGLLLLDSRMKAAADGMERYLGLRQRRLKQLHEGSIEIELELQPGPDGVKLMIRVRDSGDGFDWRRHAREPEPDETTPHGRGIAMVRQLCADLEYRGSGNEVVAWYRLGRSVPEVSEALAA